VAYANGDPAVWDTYMTLIEPYARLVPYMVGAGNHELDYGTDSGKPDGAGEHLLV
jgi:hypothetical protein